jgi:hypothetical protein
LRSSQEGSVAARFGPAATEPLPACAPPRADRSRPRREGRGRGRSAHRVP